MWPGFSKKEFKMQDEISTPEGSETNNNPEPSSDDEDFKHLSYVVSLMVEKRLDKYFRIVEETNSLMTSSTESIFDCITLWKGLSEEDSEYNFLKGDHEALSDFGTKVVKIGEVLGILQNRDPESFWTNGDKERALNLIVPMAKDAVKLKRKLGRISADLIDNLKAIKHFLVVYEMGCIPQQHSNIASTTSIALSLDDQSIMSELSLLEPGSGGSPRVFCAKPITNILNFLRSVFRNRTEVRDRILKTRSRNLEKETSEVDSNATTAGTNSYESLRSPSSSLASEGSSADSGQSIGLEHGESRIENKSLVSGSESSPDFETENELLSKIARPIAPPLAPRCSVQNSDSDEGSINQNGSHYQGKATPTDSKKDFHTKTSTERKGSSCSKESSIDLESLNQNTCKETDPADSDVESFLNDFENELDFSLATNAHSNKLFETLKEVQRQKQKRPLIIPLEDTKTEPSTIDPQTASFTTYKNLVDRMHDSVLTIIEKTREMERSWLNAGMRARESPGIARFSDVLSYIVKTVELLGDSELSEEITQATRDSVAYALGPIYRNVYSCFITLGELKQTVGTDVEYLRQLLEHFPQGDLLIYEHTNDAMANEGCQGIEERHFLPGHSIDVESIFE